MRAAVTTAELGTFVAPSAVAMGIVQKIWRELVRAVGPVFTRAVSQLSRRVHASRERPRGDAKVISILPYLERRASTHGRSPRPVQIIDLRRAPRPRSWKWPSRSPLGR